MKQKILDYYKEHYGSSPVDVDKDEINTLIKHECRCDSCLESIFDLNDYPNVSVERDEVLCEECYDEQYMTRCPVCEESYREDDMTGYFFISKKISKEIHTPPGMYKILKYPFYHQDFVFGFDNFLGGTIEKVSDIDIEEAYSMENPCNGKDIQVDRICPDCARKYLLKNNFIKADSVPCILVKSYRDEYFKKYTDENLHQARQRIIHHRITFRGILQQTNSIKK
ncbi:MAG: hypothetical protein LBR26_16110 [Prevotella sp.]|jgi:hypothetical protein|nr:hypothetical protein [Prevotella sp.]